ncbi:MAG: hypothetical protein U0L05_05785 [Schaedlerella sp.]|nr:hypothetical protein [Schaedlerella sp.]
MYIDHNIALSDTLKTTAEKAAILSEELGHHYTSYGNILDPDSIDNRKQEHHARIWSYHKLFTLEQLIEAYQKGYREFHEVAEYLEIPEEQLRDAISYYRTQYDTYTVQDGFYIIFNPYLIIGKTTQN